MSLSFWVFGAQILFSFLALFVLFRLFILPLIKGRPVAYQFFVLLSPHLFRHLGFLGFVPEVTDPNIPYIFSATLAFGDFLLLLVLYLAIWALRQGHPSSKPILWGFSLLGILHLSLVLVIALTFEVLTFRLGIVWLVATYYAPLLWVSHYYLVRALIQSRTKKLQAQATSETSQAIYRQTM